MAELADVAAGLGRMAKVAHTAGLVTDTASAEAFLRVDPFRWR